MANANKDDVRNVRRNDDAAAADSPSTLLPMLVAGLVLIIIGMIAVVSFV
jgi:hypothetical protein